MVRAKNGRWFVSPVMTGLEVLVANDYASTYLIITGDPGTRRSGDLTDPDLSLGG